MLLNAGLGRYVPLGTIRIYSLLLKLLRSKNDFGFGEHRVRHWIDLFRHITECLAINSRISTVFNRFVVSTVKHIIAHDAVVDIAELLLSKLLSSFLPLCFLLLLLDTNLVSKV